MQNSIGFHQNGSAGKQQYKNLMSGMSSLGTTANTKMMQTHLHLKKT